MKSIIITGASSGLGAALAEHYAAKGITLGLTGRSEERLQRVATLCEAKGAEVELAILDVTDAEAMAHWVTTFDEKHPVDIIIANVGISGGTEGGVPESDAQVRAIFATNLDGVMNTLHPLMPSMKQRGKGHMVIISSIAGFRGMPSAPAYSASKAAVKAYGEALRGNLGKAGIAVTVACPGYIKTPMTDVNNFPMPGIMPAPKVAAKIADAIAKNKGRIAFPLPLRTIMWLANALPSSWIDWLFAKLPTKPAMDG